MVALLQPSPKQKMSLTNRSSYRYSLPPELIAQYPPDQREHCRLLYLNRKSGSVSHYSFTDIGEFLKAGDVLVLNTTKVIPARLKGEKESGGAVEVLLIKELKPGRWECLVRPGNRLKTGRKILFSKSLQGIISDHLSEGRRVIDFQHSDDFWEIVNELGEMPLPPYIKRKAVSSDDHNYQTVYATERGSAAAPTAGLHFTPKILQELHLKGIIIVSLLLHIGLDTFRPVKVDNILEHKMHSEFCSISEQTADSINKAKKEGRRVIAVGTTSVRTLESFAVKNANHPDNAATYISSGSKWTELFIYPGYELKIVDGLITNFHLPESTLLMLVSAIGGYNNIRKAYDLAVQERYRFFSYGDAMLIL